MQSVSLVPVQIPPDFKKTKEEKVILGGSDILKKLVHYDKILEGKAVEDPIRYQKECADFHRFVKEVIPQFKKGERLEIRAVAWKEIPSHGEFRYCIYRDAAGKEHHFSVHSSCFDGYQLRPIKKHERRYRPTYDQVAM